jgi:hypothetical protein
MNKGSLRLKIKTEEITICPICFEDIRKLSCDHYLEELVAYVNTLEQEINILRYETDKRIKDLTIDRDYFKRQNEYYKDRCKVLMNDYRTAIEIIKD